VNADFGRSVFVNCPFDNQFKPLLRPLLFCVRKSGLTARLALERRDSGEVRLNKIAELIKGSMYAIHDLSRMQAEKAGELSRLNMPFELGLDIGCRMFSSDERRKKRCLVLERERYGYQAAISDLAGTDFGAHADEPEEMVAVVRDWLCSDAGCRLPGPSQVWGAFLEFMAWDFDRLSAQGYSKGDIERGLDRPSHPQGSRVALEEKEMSRQSCFPEDWDEARVRRVLEHYECQSDDAAVAEDEASLQATTDTLMVAPVELVPTVRRLIEQHEHGA
jgi:hypothetical protein